MHYAITGLVLSFFSYTIYKKYYNTVFFTKLRKKRGSLILVLVLGSIAILNIQAIYFPFYAAFLIGGFYFIRELIEC